MNSTSEPDLRRARCLSHPANFSRKFTHGDGACLVSSSGERFLDFNQASGTAILGHGVFESNLVQSQTLLLNGGCAQIELLEKSIKDLYSWIHSFILCSSGSEAVLRAIRVSRALTSKDKIAIIGGSWHGGNDQTLVRLNTIDNGTQNVISMTKGLPRSVLSSTYIVPRNNVESVRSLRDKGDIAAILVETIQGSFPCEYNPEFITELNKLKDFGIILIADEIITGIRCREFIYSKQSTILSPDIYLLGKALAGGAPIGLVAINEESPIAANIESNISDIFLGGTFSGNPFSVSMLLSMVSQRHLISDERERMISLSADLRNEVNNTFNHFSLPFRMVGFETINRIISWDDKIYDKMTRDKFEDSVFLETLRASFLASRIFYSNNGLIFISGSHYKEHIDCFVKCLKGHLETI